MVSEKEMKTHALWALGLCLSGIVIAVAIGMLARLVGYHAVMPAYLVFLGFQVAGFILGVQSRQQVIGKTAYITALVLSVGSVLLIA